MSLKDTIESVSKLGRLDLAVADVRTVDKNTVKLAVSYLNNFGIPTKTQMNEFFDIHLKELKANMDSIYKVKGQDVVVLLASLKPVIRPASDISKLKTVVAGLKFLDSELGEFWESTKQDGQLVLQQVIKQDVAALVKERANRMGRATAEFEINAAVNVVPGDRVKAWDHNHSFEGTVKKVEKNKVLINVDGRDQEFDIHGVYKIFEKAPSFEKQETNKLQDYYTQVFGPSYAKNMVKK